jgi:chorismate mutase/prephenate dehydratase
MTHPTPEPPELSEIRARIDALDDCILDALSERHRVVRQVIRGKLAEEAKIRDPEREAHLLERLRGRGLERGLDPYFVEQLFREILRDSVRFQTHALVDHQNARDAVQEVRIAFQGTDGAYSHQAALRHFGQRHARVTCVGYTRFEEAAEAVVAGAADAAILPIENTTAGSINDTYDLLNEKPLHVVGEEVLKVDHCLLAVEAVPVANIRRVLSHPQAIAQCSRFLGTLERCHVESYFDTAMAARKVRDEADLSQAAIAGAWAAELYGLQVIGRDLANQPGNFTRFVAVARDPLRCDPQLRCRTSLVMATIDEKGALLACLNVLGDHGINLTKLESRPRPGHPWQSLFYLDLEGNREEPRVEAALDALARKAQYLKVLGSYPMREGPA